MRNPDKQNNHTFQINLSKLSHYLTISATVIVLAFLISLAITPNIEVTRTRTPSDYHTITDYTYQEVTDTTAPIGMKKEYTFTLDDNIETTN